MPETSLVSSQTSDATAGSSAAAQSSVRWRRRRGIVAEQVVWYQ